MNNTSVFAFALATLLSLVFPSTAFSETAPQPTESVSTWSTAYGGVDKSYDTHLLTLRDEIAPTFQTLTFHDSVTGRTMDYNLYIPEDYDSNKSYPLVLFMADASTTGKGAEAPLKQGYGGIIWATPENQAKHPSFVLVPAFAGPDNATNDDWEISQEVPMALRLLNHITFQYNVDKSRIYTTGQSMGGMVSFYLNAHYPNLFAASLFVGSQWDVKALAPLANMHFFYIVSAGDQKASAGMKALGDMLSDKGVSVASTEFSAQLPHQEQEQKIQQLLAKGEAINFVQFTKGTAPPKGNTHPGAEHMYSFDYAYQLEGVRDWLYAQRNSAYADVENIYLHDNATQAFTDFLTLAEHNNSLAQYEVGKAYQQGNGTDKNMVNALEWYKHSATLGYDRAILDLGIFYLEGKEVPQDYTLAHQYFEQAWQYGHMKAPRYLGLMAEHGLGENVDYAKAMKMYRAASDAGDITAAALIGHLYEQGLGVPQSNTDALNWYLKAAPSPEQAAANVHPRIQALLRLGYFYEHGIAVTQDKTQALLWYQVAANDQNAEAMAAVTRLSH
ncbi:alpha/beta hydrolase-fold protein [Vibrio fluvialis]|uniref:Uncharacterized protein n=2 Tax=Vibrio TaxID=662 RepID=S7I930_VIBFL|nr:alpha/beta hydrolase-fold protein [Vibrio fluvialis]EPP24579.1 hypothetical protein L910_2025 [Vibrio fluvialis PG41]MBY7801425.1 SEL1-like repeat protein [Vibrio fluvialis]MBY7840719.1 SEL1-like repeat protein [Vibrio fluvialis]MBY7892842.1 SEL1-like repeat protein [Vibrio fluvialis]MBY8106245.1 SEL1-like repeat protein [Vibrio fluvialis]